MCKASCVLSDSIAESNAASSNFDNAAKWEHCRIPSFIIISLCFTTSIFKAPYLRDAYHRRVHTLQTVYGIYIYILVYVSMIIILKLKGLCYT